MIWVNMKRKPTRNGALRIILLNIWDEYNLYKKNELKDIDYKIIKEKILLLKLIGNLMLGKKGRLYKEILFTEEVILEKR